MPLKVQKLLQMPLLSSVILLGSQATAQDQEVKPSNNNPNHTSDIGSQKPPPFYPNQFNDENPWKPKNDQLFINENLFKNFDRRKPSDDYFNFDDDSRNKNGSDLIGNIVLFTIGVSLVLGVPFLMFLNLKKLRQAKEKEFDEFLSENEQYNRRSTSTSKMSTRERECRKAILEILKQRGGIDPSIYK